MSSAGAPFTPAATDAPIDRPRDEFARLIRSRFPIVFVDTSEEGRAEGVIRSAASACARSVWFWSISEGLNKVGVSRAMVDRETVPIDGALTRISELSGDDVFVLRDAAAHIEASTCIACSLPIADASTRGTTARRSRA